MHFRSTLIALVALTLCSGLAAVAKPADDPTAAAPACFTACAAKSAADVGCSSATDAACFCTKEDFIKANARCTMASCPDVAMNTTLTMGSFKALETICKKAIGAKNFNLTIPTMAELGMSMNASASATTSNSGSHQGATTTTSTDAAPTLQPPMAHVISACLVLSALVAGSALIL